MKRALLLCVLLVACRPPAPHVQQTKGSMDASQTLNDQLLAYFSGPDFKAFDAQEIFGPDIQDAHSLGYVTALSREAVQERVAEVIDPFVEDQVWADDYGQLHGSFVFKGQPNRRFGLGISLMGNKQETFKNHPELLKGYQTSIVYVQPYTWEPQQ
ncbi:hypothetical protein [Deinococcus daejeonensis]|uniref:Lipoprotein n=1 Tax=Deinococcus daejeonensis TaxID=1007098 RepID=A0ABQ2J8Y9_9DEIO|nr:hypothetical protein [Deinococcus daejeonensis]GGN42688.1 hypothetical protein GCM10010842_29360 [Deinococcus daejeonensis]